MASLRRYVFVYATIALYLLGLFPELPKATITLQSTTMESSVGHDSSSLYINHINYLINRHFSHECYRDERIRPVKYLKVPRRPEITNSKLLVLVVTRWDDFNSRAQWRRTYANRKNRIRYGYDVIFAVGADTDADVQRKVDAEAESEGDILQADFLDSYRNLTLKVLSAFRYVAVALGTASTIMKIDADVGWRIKNLTVYVNNHVKPRQNAIYCHRFADGFPVRRSQHKWYVPHEEYSHHTFPPFCLGWSYLLTTKAVRRILQNVHQQRFLWLEDVFITGILTNNNGVEIINIGHDKYFRATTSMENFERAWLFHLTRRNLSIVELYKVLNNIF